MCELFDLWCGVGVVDVVCCVLCVGECVLSVGLIEVFIGVFVMVCVMGWWCGMMMKDDGVIVMWDL